MKAPSGQQTTSRGQSSLVPQKDLALGRTEAPHGQRFHPQIHALRAVAVLMVLAYHFWPERFTGGFIGVDVFLVLSGFLITGQIVKRLDSGWTMLPMFWLRRVLRLAPAALAVVISVAVVSFLFVPAALWEKYAREAIGSVAIIVNVLLYGDAVDYLAAENTPTPFQHFWSLSVEEQFYLFWPVLLVLAGILIRRYSQRRDQGLSLFIVVIGIAGLSFSVSLVVLEFSASAAYFLMPLRIWEFALGGVFWFLMAHWGRLRSGGIQRSLARSITFVGYFGLALLGFRLTGSAMFPGWPALVVVLLVGAIILTHPSAEFSKDGFWGALEQGRITRFTADVSYSAYLWHWPIIVLFPFVVQREPTLGWKLLMLLVTFLLAWITTNWIEGPFRSVRSTDGKLVRRRALFLAGTATLAVSIWVLMAVSSVVQSQAGPTEATGESCFAASALLNDPNCAGTPHGEIPSVAELAASEVDRPDPWKRDCVAKIYGDDPVRCDYLISDGSGPALVLWGDSHAGAWSPAVAGAAHALGYDLYTFSRDGCPPSVVSPTATVSREIDRAEQVNCRERNQQVIDFVEETPNVRGVIASNFSTNYVFPEETMFGGISEALAAIDAPSRPAVLLRDVPLTGASVTDRVHIPKCLVDNVTNPSVCDNPREVALNTAAQSEFVADSTHGAVDVVETADGFCDDSSCFSIVGGVPVYFDASHLTDEYSRSLSGWLAEQLEPVLAAQ